MCVHWRLGYAKLQSKRFAPPSLLTQPRSYSAATPAVVRQEQRRQRAAGEEEGRPPGTAGEDALEVVADSDDTQSPGLRHTIVEALVDAAMRILLPQATAAHSSSGDTVTRIALSAVGFTAKKRSAGPSITAFFSSSSPASAGMSGRTAAARAPAGTSNGGGGGGGSGDGAPATQHTRQIQMVVRQPEAIAAEHSKLRPELQEEKPEPTTTSRCIASSSTTSSSTTSSGGGGGGGSSSAERRSSSSPGLSLTNQRAYLQEIDAGVLSQLPPEIQQEMRRAIHGGGTGKRRRIDDFFSRR
jgi:hypothetical protein